MAERRHKILMDLVFYYGHALSDCTSNCIVMSRYGTTLKYDDSPSFCRSHLVRMHRISHVNFRIGQKWEN